MPFTTGEGKQRNRMQSSLPEQVKALFFHEKSINEQYVSTVDLNQCDSNLNDCAYYASQASGKWADSWEEFSSAFQTSLSHLDLKMQENLKEIYEYTAKLPLILLGEGIGELKFAESDITGEVVFPQVNIRGVICKTNDENLFLKTLLEAIAPKQTKQLLFITREKMEAFHKARAYSGTRYHNLFSKDFCQTFQPELSALAETFLKTRVELAFLLPLLEKHQEIKTDLVDYLQNELDHIYDPQTHEIHIRTILNQFFNCFELEEASIMLNTLPSVIVSKIYQVMEDLAIPIGVEAIRKEGQYLSKNTYETIYKIKEDVYKIPESLCNLESNVYWQPEAAAQLWNETFTALYEGQFAYLAVAKALTLLDNVIALKLPYMKGMGNPDLGQLQTALQAINKERLYCEYLHTEVISGYTLPAYSNFFQLKRSLINQPPLPIPETRVTYSS
jgi:hypothetical protein